MSKFGCLGCYGDRPWHDDDCNYYPKEPISAAAKPDLIVTIKPGLDGMSIEWTQRLEKDISAALVRNGFSLTGTTKGGEETELRYRQFGACR